MSGLYIHIPFCKQACSYCDFYFLTRQELRNPFVDALLNEIKGFADSPFAGQVIETIYIGGGTPSLLSGSQLKAIFRELESVFTLDTKEVTMEMNPDDVTPAYLRELLQLGVNRASMGVQSFDENLLTFMHRAHNPTEALQALEALAKTGFPSFTADLIYGSPGQTPDMLLNDIEALLQFNPPHISAYSLTIEPGTRLGKQAELGRLSMPEDEAVAEQFDLLAGSLADAGIEQYEVSNFAIPGKEAVHNSNYWRHKNYLGVGPSAHSFTWQNERATRWQNAPDLKGYLAGDDIRTQKEELSPIQLADERLMLGLRTKWGVEEKELSDRYNYTLSSQQLEWLRDQRAIGNFVDQKKVLKLTGEGLKIADYLVVELLSKG